MPDLRREAAERTTLARITALNTLVGAVEEAVSTYMEIMRGGSNANAGDRIKAADRILQLAGVEAGKPLTPAEEGKRGLHPEEDPRDARLLAVLNKLDGDRAKLVQTRIIDAVSREAEADTG